MGIKPGVEGSHQTPISTASTPFGSVKSLGASFNPLNHIPGMIRGFGGNATESAGAAPSRPGSTARGESTKLDPPIQRFLDAESAADLSVGDVSVLLEDYKRLASVFAEGTL